MSDRTDLDELLSFDPLSAAEKLTGADYKTDEATMKLGFAMGMLHNERKDAVLAARDDTSYNTPWADTKRIYASLGFEVVRDAPFIGTYGREEHLTWWRPDGILAVTESYSRDRTNNSKILYNWRPGPHVDRWQFTSSGRFHRDSYDRGERIWVGDHDAREGLRHKLGRLEDNGDFVMPWVDRPFIWLLNYQQFRGEASYEARQEAREALLGELAAHVRKAIGWARGPAVTFEEIYALCTRYLDGEISADDYFAACDVYAHEMIEQELRDMATRRGGRKS